MHERSKPRACWRQLVLAVALALCGVSLTAQSAPRVVLVLFSEARRLPATTTMFEGLERGLAGAKGVSLVTQYLDVAEFASPQRQSEMAAFLTNRYADRPVDVVVTISPPATRFAAEYGATIWPAAKTVSITFPGNEDGAEHLSPGSVVIPLVEEFLSTAGTALSLLPQTDEIVLVAGSSPADGRYLTRAKASLAPLSDRVTLTEIRGLSMAGTQARLATLRDNAIVLVAMFFADADGLRFAPHEAVEAFASASRRPIFGLHDTWIGTGVLGGHTFDYEGVGRAAAAATLEVLAGTPQPAVPAATHWVFDSRALNRFGIDERRLPAGSRVLFREPSLWVQYRWWVIGAAAAVALEGGIIAALLLERRARRRSALALQASELARHRTEAEMRLQLHELAHLNVVAAIGQSAAAMVHELKQPLTAVLANAQTLQRMLLRQDPRNSAALEIMDDIISEDKRAGEVIERLRRVMKKEAFEWSPVDVNAIVRDVTRLMGHEAAHAGVQLIADLNAALPAARGDRVQLQQVVLNLVQNGLHAAADNPATRGRVLVRTDFNGSHLNVSVRDSGRGVDPEVGERVFDPFFTTKPSGLGLGLAISRTIVEQHGGSLDIHSPAGGGAEFSMRLPAEESAA